MLEDVQHLEQHHPAAGRPVARDPVATVRAPERGVARGAPAAQILRAEQPVVLAHVLHDGVRDLALVEHLVAVLGDQPQGVAEIAIHHAVAHALGRAVGPAVERARGRRERQPLVVRSPAHLPVLRPPGPDVRAHRPAALRPRDRRLQDLLPRQPPVLAMRVAVGAQAGRRADGLVADVVHAPAQDEAVAVARLRLDAVGPHVGAHRERGGRVEVDVAVEAGGGHRDAAAPEARDAAHQRVHHALHEGAGHRGVHRVAARLQDLRAGLGGLRLGGHDHRALAVSHGLSCP